MRTVSLLPSATEVVAGVGGVDTLVGRSHRCNRPAAVESLPVVTESAIDAGAADDPATIDDAVEDHRHGEHTAFRVREDALAAVEPDVLVTQALCEVCAVPESMTVAAMERLDPEPTLVTVSPSTIPEILETIDQVGAALDHEVGATQLRSSLIDRIDAVTSRVPTDRTPPRVVCLEWADPLRSHGLWIPECVERLGAENGFGVPGEHGRPIDWADVRAFDPDVLVVSPCGRTIPQIERDVEHLTGRPGWSSLTAVQDDRVFLLDGELSSRHGPRVVRAFELLARMCYPDVYDDVSWSADEVRPWTSKGPNGHR